MDIMSDNWHQKNKKHKLKLQKERLQQSLIKWRNWKSEQGCQYCNENEAICLELHHLDPTIKDDSLANMVAHGVSWKNLMEEAKKCIVVCSNCHRKIHAGILNIGD